MLPLALSLQQCADLAAIIGVIGVLAVLYQLRQARRDGEVALITGMTTMMLEIDKTFIEYPAMRKYFKAEVRPPQGSHAHEQAQAIAMAMANALDHVVEHMRYMKCDTRQAWRKYIAELYEQSPVFADLLKEHGDWWPGLQREVREWRKTGRLGTWICGQTKLA